MGEKKMNTIFLGLPGVGKGTNASRVGYILNIPHISTGDIFRENMKNKTELGEKIRDLMDSGHYVPDDVTMEIVLERIKQADCKKGFILDGVPRTINQAQILEDNNVPINYAFKFEVGKEIAKQRMLNRMTCGSCKRIYNSETVKPKRKELCDYCDSKLIKRTDETLEVIEERLNVYKNQTAPLIDYYHQKDVLVNINADRSIDKIVNEIIKTIENPEL